MGRKQNINQVQWMVVKSYGGGGGSKVGESGVRGVGRTQAVVVTYGGQDILREKGRQKPKLEKGEGER